MSQYTICPACPAHKEHAMFPMDRRDVPLDVEYDCRGRRARRTFTSIREARAFYLLKDRQGKNPRVLKPLPAQPTLWDLAVRYWGGEVDPLRPQVVCPVCRHRLDWHDAAHGCTARVGNGPCGCKGPEGPAPAGLGR